MTAADADVYSEAPVRATDDATEAEVAAMPSVPKWNTYFCQIPELGRRVEVSSPCVGISGTSHALNEMGVPADSINVRDGHGPRL
jgi:hypothetical protein